MTKMIFAIAASLLATELAHADVMLINDDFSSGTISTNNRIRTNQTDGNWYTDNSPASDWTIGGGVISNAGTTTTSVSEGALSQVIATNGLSSSLTQLDLSFDYTVGDTSTLKFALIGYTLNVQAGQSATNTLLLNNGTANGSIQNNTQAELRYGDINLLTGADMTQSITNDLTFAAGMSGSFSGSFDLTAYSWNADELASAGNTPGLSGSITSIADFDFVVLAVVNDLSTTTGASTTSLDNFSLVASSSVATVPEPSSFAMLLFGGAISLRTMRRKRAQSSQAKQA